ncbi:hypothetical protein IJ425_07570 [bacterium]|nr:hypothetical protein [bacterium]
MALEQISLGKFLELSNAEQLSTITLPQSAFDEAGNATGGYSIFNNYIDDNTTRSENGVTLSQDKSLQFYNDLIEYGNKNGGESELSYGEFKQWYNADKKYNNEEIKNIYLEFYGIFDSLITGEISEEDEEGEVGTPETPVAAPASNAVSETPTTSANTTDDKNLRIANGYLTRANEALKGENATLTAENEALEADVETLNEDLTAAQLKNGNLIRANDSLTEEANKAKLEAINAQIAYVQRTTALDRLRNSWETTEKITVEIDGVTYETPEGLTFETAEEVIDFAYKMACNVDGGNGDDEINQDREYAEFLRQTCGYGTMPLEEFMKSDAYKNAADKDKQTGLWHSWLHDLNEYSDYTIMNDGVLSKDEAYNSYSGDKIRDFFPERP